MRDTIHHGDCLDVMGTMPPDSVDLIVTSPPYAGVKRDYGMIPHDEYIDWFTPRVLEMYRILKPTGSFILNIKENIVDGTRSLYVMELVLFLVNNQKWLLNEEYIWHKKNPWPGRWNIRFKDAWEHLYHFSKTKEIKFNRSDVMYKKSKKSIIRDMKREHIGRTISKSGLTRNFKDASKTKYNYPTNVIHCHVENNTSSHTAPFPSKIPEFFIKLLSDPGNIVLDPFVGSGTTLYAARKLGRVGVGIELYKEYYETLRKDYITNTLESYV